MNDNKPKYRYWLALMLDDLPLGTVFQPHRLHITIIPWFVVGRDENYLLRYFHSTYDDQLGFTVKLDKEALFGPDKDVSVILVEPHERIEELHRQALSLFEAVSARWAVQHPHVGFNFRAHIRKRPEISLQLGQIYNIRSLSLIRASRHEDEQREVIAKAEFR